MKKVKVKPHARAKAKIKVKPPARVKTKVKYLLVIENAGPNYCAFSPDVLGCGAAGDTIEETLKLYQEALDAHLELMAEDGDPLPRAKGIDYYLKNEPGFYQAADDLLTHVEIDLSKYTTPVAGTV